MEPVRSMITVFVVCMLVVTIGVATDAGTDASGTAAGTRTLDRVEELSSAMDSDVRDGAFGVTGVPDSRPEQDPSTRDSSTDRRGQWMCSATNGRGVLVARHEDRAGSCASRTELASVEAIDVAGVTEDQMRVLLWALDLFEQADMVLPTFRMTSEHEDACDGYAAVVSSTAQVPHVRVCTPRTGPSLEWVVLHELGHIWAERHVDADHQALFLAVRSLAAWRSDVRAESGTEQAADVIVWALMDRPVRPIHLLDMSCIELGVAHRALTGERPLNGFTEVCGRH